MAEAPQQAEPREDRSLLDRLLRASALGWGAAIVAFLVLLCVYFTGVLLAGGW
jgi:hypothetical protein